MFKTPQTITLHYAGKQQWFEVWRYETVKEFQMALLKDGVRDFDEKTTSYTQIFKKGDECGRMHLLDKSIESLAREASNMAFGISARVGNNELNDDFEADHSAMTGHIVSELYSKHKYF